MQSEWKGSLYPGFRKSRYSCIERVYPNPKFNALSDLRSIIGSILVGTGLIGGAVSITKAARAIDKYTDSNFYNFPTSRRNFLKTAAITATTVGLLSCEKEEKPLEEIIDPPTPIITGPTELTIPRVGVGIKGTFDSAGTKGATEINWQLIKPLSLMDNIEQKGSETKADIIFSVPGINEVRLITDNEAGRTNLTYNVKINPPKLPEIDYDLPVLLIINESLGSIPIFAVYSWETKTRELTRIFSGKRFYDSLNWEPSGQRMVFVSYPGPYEFDYPKTPSKITTYNLLNGSFKEISNNTTGLAWSPKWSPQGDWIAYLDDSESINYGTDVIALIRPDGSDQFYLDGLGQSREFSAIGLTWSPDGTRLLGGGSLYHRFKIAVFDKILNGSPVVTATIPTDKQLERYFDSNSQQFIDSGISKDWFMRLFCAGLNGMAWSPDGIKVVYQSSFGGEFIMCYALLLSNVDGTGDIETIAISYGEYGFDLDFYLPVGPTWTPDGSAIFFSAQKRGIECLYKYDMITKKYEEVLLPNTKVRAPFWYG